jgi:hypothetical protein
MTKKRKKTGGRTIGTPNKATALIRQRIDEADPIAFLITVANGDRVGGETPTIAERCRAAEWLGRKVVPDAKERPVTFKLPTMATSQDAVTAIGNVIEEMSAGNITPGEANSVCGVIGNYIKAFEVNEILARLEALEETAKS